MPGLSLFDSIVGANSSAAAAADASVGIDVVDITLADSLYGANRLACATCDTSVSNNVSHNSKIFNKVFVRFCKFTIIYLFSQIIEGKFALI